MDFNKLTHQEIPKIQKLSPKLMLTRNRFDGLDIQGVSKVLQLYSKFWQNYRIA